jgi:hypothetical protein
MRSVQRRDLASSLPLWADTRCSRAALWRESHDDSETRVWYINVRQSEVI